MASRSLRRYDVQAKVSLVTSVLGCIGVLGLIVLLARNYDSGLSVITYRTGTLYAPAFLLGTAVTMLLSAIGLVMGFSSAGQRRNTMQGRSWAAFFVSTAVLAGAIICFTMFWRLGMRLP